MDDGEMDFGFRSFGRRDCLYCYSDCCLIPPGTVREFIWYVSKERQPGLLVWVDEVLDWHLVNLLRNPGDADSLLAVEFFQLAVRTHENDCTLPGFPGIEWVADGRIKPKGKDKCASSNSKSLRPAAS